MYVLPDDPQNEMGKNSWLGATHGFFSLRGLFSQQYLQLYLVIGRNPIILKKKASKNRKFQERNVFGLHTQVHSEITGIFWRRRFLRSGIPNVES
jgi:hypothetical protein